MNEYIQTGYEVELAEVAAEIRVKYPQIKLSVGARFYVDLQFKILKYAAQESKLKIIERIRLARLLNLNEGVCN